MADHSECKVTVRLAFPDGETRERHECGSCPHGLIKGFEMTLRGDPEIDDIQRQLKFQALDASTCDTIGHARELGSAPMCLLADAERLLDRQPLGSDGACIHCERVPQKQGHANDCAWIVAHQRILRTLKLVEKVAKLSVWAWPFPFNPED